MNRRAVLTDWAITRVLVLVTILAVIYVASPPSVVVDRQPLPDAAPAVGGVMTLEVEVGP